MFGRKLALLSFISLSFLLATFLLAILLVPPLVFAYTLGDLANDLRQLFAPAGTAGTRGGIFDFFSNFFAQQYATPTVTTGKSTYAPYEILSFTLSGFPAGYRVIEIAVLDGGTVKADLAGVCNGCPITVSSSGSGSGSFFIGDNLGTGSRTLRVTASNPSSPQSKSTASTQFTISGTSGNTYDYTVSVNGLINEFTYIFRDSYSVGCLSNTGTGPSTGPCGNSDTIKVPSGTHTISVQSKGTTSGGSAGTCTLQGSTSISVSGTGSTTFTYSGCAGGGGVTTTMTVTPSTTSQYCGQQVSFNIKVTFGQAGTYNVYMQAFPTSSGNPAGQKVGLSQDFQQYEAKEYSFYHFLAMWCENIRVHFSVEDRNGNVYAERDVILTNLGTSTSCTASGSALSLNPQQVTTGGANFVATATFDQACVGKSIPVAIGLGGCTNRRASGTLGATNWYSATLTAPTAQGTYTYYACIDGNKDGTYEQGGSATLQVGITPSGQCANPYQSRYGNVLCMGTTGTCGWQGTDSVTFGAADANGNIPVDFRSAYANGVNVFILYGRISGVTAGNVPGYAKASSVDGIGDDICSGAATCDPTVIAYGTRNYCTNIEQNLITTTSATPISSSSLARALMPLNLVDGRGSITIVPTTGSPSITLLYQFYRDMGLNNGYSECDAQAGPSDKCSANACNNLYSGCTGIQQTRTNSYLCIKTGATTARAGYACWHYPWETSDGWTSLNIPAQGAAATTTTTTTTTTAATSPTTATSPPSPTTTTTATITTTTTTTTTTPTLLPLVINCKQCYAKSECSCSIATSDCIEGLWTVSSKEGTPPPLTSTISSNIPPHTVNFTPNTTGKVNVTARCFDAPPKFRSNSTIIDVLNPFLVCQEQGFVNQEVQCTVSNCNSGLYSVTLDTDSLTSGEITSSPFTIKFTSGKIGDAKVSASCSIPSIPIETRTVKILTSLITATTTPLPGTFTGTGFKCAKIDSNTWECSFLYDNKVGQDVVVQFLFAKTNGEVLATPPAPRHNIASSGNGVAKVIFDCTSVDSGRYTVSWKAYRDELKRNPIAWSTSSELQQIDC